MRYILEYELYDEVEMTQHVISCSFNQSKEDLYLEIQHIAFLDQKKK
jgi:hypothetical protein